MSGAKEQGAQEQLQELNKQNGQLRKERSDQQRTIDRLARTVEDLTDQVKQLQRMLEQALRSSKRQAAPFSKGEPKKDPKKPGRKPGAKYGKKAHRPVPPKVDEILEAKLPRRCACGGRPQPEKIEYQYQVEIPRKPIRRRFDVQVGHCQDCGKRIQGRHALQTSDALGAARSQVGPEAKALVVKLNKELGLSHAKVCQVMSVFQIGLTRGASAQIVLGAAQRVRPAYQQIFRILRRSKRVTPDETGWRVGGWGQWLWTFVARLATLYLIRPSRGKQVAEEALGATYAGVMVHDGWAVYDRFTDATHQQCLAHLLRRCGTMQQSLSKKARWFVRELSQILKRGLELRDRRDQGEVGGHGLAVARGQLQARLDRLLQRRPFHMENLRFSRYLQAHRDQIFTFLRYSGVEATNWQAEQAIRPAVVNRKVWGGNRTERGAEAQAILMSVLRTCWQRGVDTVEYLSRAWCTPQGTPLTLPSPAGIR